MAWYLRRRYLLFPYHILIILARVFSIVLDVSVTQVARKLSRRTKGKSSGSLSEIDVAKRADGCQSVVEVEESCSFSTIPHVFERFSKKKKKRKVKPEEVQNFPASSSPPELSSRQISVCMRVRWMRRERSKRLRTGTARRAGTLQEPGLGRSPS